MRIIENGITEARLIDAVREAAEFFFVDWPEGQGIGSSDMNAAVRFVIVCLDADPDDRETVPLEDFVEIRNMIRYEMQDFLS